MLHFLSKTAFISLFLCSITSQPFFAQTTSASVSKDELLFQKGLLLHKLAVEGLGLNETIHDRQDLSRSSYATEIKADILDDAFKYYQELTDSFPKSVFFYKALINQGLVKLEQQDTVEAEKSLQQVLGPKVFDKPKKKTPVQQELLSDPNSGYKNEAARIMAEVALANHEYQRALSLLDERKKYPRAGAFNTSDGDEMLTAELYGKCYMALKKYQKTCDVLLPYLFSDELDFEGEDLLYEALLKTNKKDDLIKKYEGAFKTWTIDKAATAYFIVFLNQKITIADLLKPALLIEDPAYPANSLEKIYKDTWLYKRLLTTEEEKKP